MPAAAPWQNGPQPIRPYTYPRGNGDAYGNEWIYRHCWVTDDIRTADAIHTLEVTDGLGGLPIVDQPSRIDLQLDGVVQYRTKVTVTFTRRGETGPYEVRGPSFDHLVPGPRQTHLPSMAQ